MAMLSTTHAKLTFLLPHTAAANRRIRPHRLAPFPAATPNRRPISAAKLPSPPPSSPSGEVYQPFRPPPAPLPSQYRSLSPTDRLDILRNRLGIWHDYAPLIPSLSREGFTPPSIEEATGISGVEQNRLIVAAQVRDSLVSSEVDQETLAFFDIGGAELLYELRLLNAAQRAASARRIAEHRLDPKAAQQLARAVKDFGRRRCNAWEFFSSASPGDCLAYSHFRLSREALSPADQEAALEKALEAAETDAAKERIAKEIEARSGKEAEAEEEEEAVVPVPVVRLRYGEIAESTMVAVLPVCDAAQGVAGVVGAPRCRAEGEFGVVVGEKGWTKWVVLPGWGPVMGILDGAGVAVAFKDGTAVPWKTRRADNEGALAVTDRGRTEVVATGIYLVGGGEGGGEVKMQRGSNVEGEVLGTVVLVVRPPRDETDNQITDEDWD